MTNIPRCQRDDSLRRIFFRRSETISVQFEEEHPDDKSSALIAVREGVATNNPFDIQGGEPDYVDVLSVGVMLFRTRQCTVERRNIANTFQSTMLYEKPLVDD